MNVRTAAALVVGQVLRHQGSLSSLLPEMQSKVPERDRPLLQELCYGCLRWQPQLALYVERLLDKPLRAKDSDIQALLLLGLYQLIYTRIPDHAALSATVDGARALKKPWATRLINGVLRRFQRERETLDEQLQKYAVFSTAHPRWLLDALKTAWPEQFDALIHANNSHPPLTLRLNPRAVGRDAYLAMLTERGIEAQPTPYSEVGIQLTKPCDPTGLPLFADGGVSVQDEAAQLPPPLLELAPGQRVLDACSAPGGKTGHILETEPGLAQVVALMPTPAGWSVWKKTWRASISRQTLSAAMPPTPIAGGMGNRSSAFCWMHSALPPVLFVATRILSIYAVPTRLRSSWRSKRVCWTDFGLC